MTQIFAENLMCVAPEFGYLSNPSLVVLLLFTFGQLQTVSFSFFRGSSVLRLFISLLNNKFYGFSPSGSHHSLLFDQGFQKITSRDWSECVPSHSTLYQRICTFSHVVISLNKVVLYWATSTSIAKVTLQQHNHPSLQSELYSF